MRNKILLFVSAMLVSISAWSLEDQPFTQERFDALQAEGELILVDVYADWCSTCKRQQELIKLYRETHPDVDLHILKVDFDDDKATVRQLRAPRQSTLLVYKGEKQYWYSVAETDQDVLFAAINRAADAK